MEKKFTSRNDILDILFANRNKAYGAYELRIKYNKRMKLALSLMFVVCLLFTVGSILAKNKTDKNDIMYVGPEIELSKVEEPPVEEVKPPEPEIEKPNVAQEVLTAPRIVEDELVKEDDVMLEVKDYDAVKIGLEKMEGAEDIGVVVPPVEKTTDVVKLKESNADVYTKDFIPVQIPAEFPGGLQGWTRYLEKNLNSDIPIENGAPPSQYTVIVTFIVDKDGKVSDVKAENDPGYGTKEEAIRVIKKGPNWIPANQNGKLVVYRHKQAITFRVTEQ
ncbi:MAG: energy transducer TonB [Chitinophagaceae bacterium]|jgi:periplasmic protein TonB|uniref:energy transducer TonB n=1 Tax=Sediminibacterium sp. TaxID=1917865 RepID=UPI001BC46272|nr:energy transducer TonB [Sediminibacterium sp.]MBS4065165.1 energy transducer TonB [Chitinophagaceae bacterium]MDZ4072580.1 energy transducer TonB [Sediminibacterium sp.]